MKINWKAIPEGLKILGKIMEKNKSTILVAAGIGGWIGTTVLASKQAVKAKSALNQAIREKTEMGADEPAELTVADKVKATWQYYIPVVVSGAASSAVIILAHKIDLSKIASITASYQLAKGELKNLKDKIIEKDGPEKLKDYEKEVHNQTMVNSIGDTIYNTGDGNTIFFDPTSNTFFYSDIWKVTKELMTMVNTCKNGDTYSLAELSDGLGLPRTYIIGRDDYVFTYDSVRDIDLDSIQDLFEYHSINAEKGDFRPCIWLNIKDILYNIYDIGDSRPSFRRKYL